MVSEVFTIDSNLAEGLRESRVNLDSCVFLYGCCSSPEKDYFACGRGENKSYPNYRPIRDLNEEDSPSR